VLVGWRITRCTGKGQAATPRRFTTCGAVDAARSKLYLLAMSEPRSIHPTPETPTAALRYVLVADDEPYIGRILQMKLEQGPYRVSLASDGREALNRLRSDERIDAVLLDIMMPHLTGLEVLEAARTLPHRRETPIMILTAKGQDSDRSRAFELGADDFFTKPFSPKRLQARLDEFF
jgi:two-component system, OmpR family, alkaline phosphatase synthesis response regulator PhoP